jgi:hypothetical protein
MPKPNEIINSIMQEKLEDAFSFLKTPTRQRGNTLYEDSKLNRQESELREQKKREAKI